MSKLETENYLLSMKVLDLKNRISDLELINSLQEIIIKAQRQYINSQKQA